MVKQIPARNRTSPAPTPSAGATEALPGLDIVVVNWNTGEFLRNCLLSIAASRHTAFTLDSVIVVDNSSSDGSADRTDDVPLPQLHVIHNAENLGFATACNQGAKEGTAPFVLFLNPDTTLFPETLDRVLSFLALPEAARVGICGGQMIGDDGKLQASCARFPRLPMFLAKATGAARLLPSLTPSQWISVDEIKESQPVDHVIGAFFLMRRPLFEDLGGFDERFFLYYEEIELAYRARIAGFLSYFLADAPVIHKGNVSSSQIIGPRIFYVLHGRTEFARLYWPRRQTLTLTAMTLLIEFPSRLALALARRRGHEVRAVAVAFRLYTKYVAAVIQQNHSHRPKRSRRRHVH
ncbi:hypothetical protein AQJ23_25535 [Streptomyces antibioticus]|nr:glycosyltransferase family 2 protein [Streptomyces antibioticus]KUN23384.1 hypothetical protein AQJ23_25535 [Streptomyces antibioticus]